MQPPTEHQDDAELAQRQLLLHASKEFLAPSLRFSGYFSEHGSGLSSSKRFGYASILSYRRAYSKTVIKEVFMECPRCGEKMLIYKEEPCFSKDGKQYKRTKYRCEHDDVWGRLEVPVVEAKESPDVSAITQ